MSRVQSFRTTVALATVAVLAVVGAAALPADAATTISARVETTHITLGSSVGVTGTIADRTATRTYLQRKVSSTRWVDVAAMNVRNGAFRTTITPEGVGIYSLRVRSNGGSVISPTFYLKVTTTLDDGTYRFSLTDPRDYTCPGQPLGGRTLTVTGTTATVRGTSVATLSGKVLRTGSTFSMSLDSTDPSWIANLSMAGTVMPNALLVGRLKFSGINPSGQTGWVCDMPYEAIAAPRPGPSCALSTIEPVRLPAGEYWLDEPPVCSGNWAAALTGFRDIGAPGSRILRWNGRAWTLVPDGCAARYEAAIPAIVYRHACSQD